MMHVFKRPGNGLRGAMMPDVGELWKVESGHAQLRFMLLPDHPEDCFSYGICKTNRSVIGRALARFRRFEDECKPGVFPLLGDFDGVPLPGFEDRPLQQVCNGPGGKFPDNAGRILLRQRFVCWQLGKGLGEAFRINGSLSSIGRLLVYTSKLSDIVKGALRPDQIDDMRLMLSKARDGSRSRYSAAASAPAASAAAGPRDTSVRRAWKGGANTSAKFQEISPSTSEGHFPPLTAATTTWRQAASRTPSRRAEMPHPTVFAIYEEVAAMLPKKKATQISLERQKRQLELRSRNP